MVRTSRGFRPTYVEPAVTADIKTNSGNVCEYWDASCHVQQGMDSINVGVIQAGEEITSWGESTTKWIQGGFVEAGENIQSTYVETIEKPIVQGVEYIQGGFVEAGENIQDAYVKNIETPIVQGVEYVQGGIDEQIKAAQDAAAILAKNTEDAFNATIKAAQDAADATAKAAADAAAAAAKAAADAAAAAGEGATKGITDSLKIAGVAALGLGVLLVMKR